MARPAIFINIQITRLLAAMLVLLHHAVYQITENRVPGVSHFVGNLGFDGSVGVDIFFVISGFIMIVTSADRFGSSINALTFIKRRLVRIVPLYWIFTGLMVVATFMVSNALAHPDFSISYLLSSLFFIPSRNFQNMIQPVLLLGWTLNYEMMFYLVFATCMLLPAHVGVPSIFVIIGSLALAGVFVAPSASAPLVFWTRPIIVEFLLGIVVGLVTLRGIELGVRLAIMLVVGGFGGLWIASMLGWSETPLRCLAVGLPATAIIAGSAMGPQLQQNTMTQMLRFGGDASYALYLSHPFVINAVAIIWRHILIANGYAYLVVTIVVALVVAAAVHLLIERTILDALHRRPIALMRHPAALFITGRHSH